MLLAEVRGRRLLYDASTYSSDNIGCFANNAGLFLRLKAMVCLSNKAGCEWQGAEQIAKSNASAVFQMVGPLAVILVATKDIALGQQS